MIPPLAGSDFLSDRQRVLNVVMNGLTGPVTVNGQTYTSVMPPHSHLPDDAIANILTFVYSSWKNPGHRITTEEVKKVRENTKRPPGAGT